MNNFDEIYKRLISFCTYNLLLYANFLLLFGLALNINTQILISISTVLFPAYLIVGIGGYFLNDLFDEKKDLISKKFNFTQIINKYLLAIIIMLFWIFGLYLIYSISKKASVILLFQFSTLVAYSVPYLRLKERGFTGLITDALYAHVIPAIILLCLLQEYTDVSISLWIAFIVFTFLLGLRDIARHQLVDIENDKQSDTRTYAVKNLNSVKNQIGKFNTYAALTLCILLLIIQLQATHFLFKVLFFGISISYLSVFYKYKSLSKDTLISNYIIFSSIILVYLLTETKEYIGIFLLSHPYFLQKIRSLLNRFMVSIIPLFVNYCLYFFFLLLGRNLKHKPFLIRKKTKNKKG